MIEAEGARLVTFGDEIPYQDGAEDELVALFRTVSDRRAGSEELVRAIRDWPTRYHLSTERGYVLAPLSIGAGDRVLDLGAGTGAVSRAAAETGAEVVAVEGNPVRARAAALRCADLPNVTVAVGSIGDYEPAELFDVALSVGVLEYADAELGGSVGARHLLERTRGFLRPDGMLLVAIENQLGLRYLLGTPEDHLGLPYVGVEGYAGSSGIRTYTRARLAAMLADAGFTHQWWGYPFPDYKLPTAIIGEDAYRLHRPWMVLDKLITQHVAVEPFSISAPVHAPVCHRTFVEAGLGPDIANSFLVAAACSADGLERISRDVVGWKFDAGRRAPWRRLTTVSRSDGHLMIERRRPAAAPATYKEDWLRQRVRPPRSFVDAPDLLSVVTELCECDDAHAVEVALNRWSRWLRGFLVPKGTGPSHPYAPESTDRALPGSMLDLQLGNFLCLDDSFEYIDDEWEVEGDVSYEVAVTVALWWSSLFILSRAAAHPWPSGTTVDQLMARLTGACDIAVDDALIGRVRAAIAALQFVVTGTAPAAMVDSIESLGSSTATDLVAVSQLPLDQLHATIDDLHGELAAAQQNLAQREQQLDDIDGDLQRILARRPIRAYFRARQVLNRLRRLLR